MCAVLVELQVLGVAGSCSIMLIYYAHFGSRSFEQVGTAHFPRFFFWLGCGGCSPLSFCTILPVLFLLISLLSFIRWEKLYNWLVVLVTYIISCAAIEVDLSPEVLQFLAGLQVPSFEITILLFIEDWVRNW